MEKDISYFDLVRFRLVFYLTPKICVRTQVSGLTLLEPIYIEKKEAIEKDF